MANYYNADTVIYHNGNLVKAADTKIDLYNQTMHYGYGVFEGIRAYRMQDGSTQIFKADEHYDRLRLSAEALSMPFAWSNEELIAASYEVLERNNLQDAYIRPLVYGPVNMSFNPNLESNLAIEAWKMEPFLGEKLIRLMTSSFQRPNPKGFKIQAKACGHYVNSIMASYEAKANGYDEALLLDMYDFVAEGPGANVFIEKGNTLITPDLGNILPGITRATIIEICRQLDIEVVEKYFTVAEMKHADSAFYCGTAAEVIGVASLDDYIFPKTWAQTLGAQVQQAYKRLVTGGSVEELQKA